MAPYDKSADGSSLLITDDTKGQEFSVRLFPSPQKRAVNEAKHHKRWTFMKIDKKRSKKEKKTTANTTSKRSKKNEKKQQKKKKLRFDEDVRVREIPNRSEITPEEKANMWVNCFDRQAIQNERQRIGRAIMFSNLTLETQTDDCMLRGLEMLVPNLATKRRKAVDGAKTLVLREQAQARLHGEAIDEEQLARLYTRVAQESKDEAIEQAIDDYYQVIRGLTGRRFLADIV